jgi:hypothetical protein
MELPGPASFSLFVVQEMNHVRDAGTRVAGWVHFIKHERTFDILRTEFRELPSVPNRESYRYEPGNVLLVAVLRRKPNTSAPASPSDLSYWLVIVKPEAEAKP